MTKEKPMKSPYTGGSTIGGEENYRKRTLKLIGLLCSEDFKSGKLNRYKIIKMGYPRATVDYHYFRIYDYPKFKKRYLSAE